MRKFVIIAVLCLGFFPLRADEGMWLPIFLKALNEKKMQNMGFKLTAEDIYSTTNPSMKDAIVHFGGGCTGEIVSPDGLVFTNHHCGFSHIAALSSFEDNILKNGFWAKTRGEEKPAQGLSVTFIKEIKDVTDDILKNLDDNLSKEEKNVIIEKRLKDALKSVEKKDYQDVEIVPFYKGNQYFLFITETFKDIRFVGAPPSSIGNFGSETDNWMWPRHNADFSVFRIYSSADNTPTEYSQQNVPYKSTYHFPISLKGVKEGDFTMVFGFPGRTDLYLPSTAVNQIVSDRNPMKINIRGRVLKVWGKYMREDEIIKLSYADKYAGVSNAWKKWQGELEGLEKASASLQKVAYENKFKEKLATNPVWKSKWGNILPEIDRVYKEFQPYAVAYDLYTETSRVLQSFKTAIQLKASLENIDKATFDKQNFKENYLSDYKDFRKNIDKETFATLIKYYVGNMPFEYIPQNVMEIISKYKYNSDKMTEDFYSSDFFSEKWLDTYLSCKTAKQAEAMLEKLPMYKFINSINESFVLKILPEYSKFIKQINELQKEYMAAQLEVFKDDRIFFPDANSTLRVSYGKVSGMEVKDGLYYKPQTYLEGVIQKYKPNDYEFDLPEDFFELYKLKDYEPYDENGKIPVAFIATNHTSGGNSGSPAINAEGHLIGLNFDRIWEGTMSDVFYDANICRNIMVDIRYVMYIIDKYALASHILDEMTIILPDGSLRKPVNSKEKTESFIIK